MADNTAAQAAAAPSDTKPSIPVNPDSVGEELADDANIWHVYDRVAKEDDERRTKAWDSGLNNLALFAGLFSAVTTAFIIEAQQDMEPDYAQLTFLVLNASAAGEKFIQQPFVVPHGARTVNCLWVASLILSLSAALIAIMGKDWIGMYTARPVCNLRQWAEMRAYRLNCVEQWYMSGVIAAAPVLLHISLLLFGAGLVLFISSDPLTHHLTLGLSLAAGALYLVTTFSAVVFSTSPFKSPATQIIRSALSALFSYVRTLIYRPKRNLVHTLLRDINAMLVVRADETTPLPGSVRATRKSRVCLHPGPVFASAVRAAVAYMRNIPTSVRTARHSLQWSRVQSRLQSIVSPVQSFSLDEWFLSSTWTDLPADRRPELLAEALSWLNGASQAPDVFRAVVFALGDLDIGPQVGLHTSIALRTRIRSEIRRTWQQVDFLTLSRYLLACQNALGFDGWEFYRRSDRVDLSKNPALRCEDGLAARVKLWPDYIPPSTIVDYSPSHVTQPRMIEFLLPYIQQAGGYQTDALILVSNKYKAHLRTGESFNSSTLEAHLYRSLDAPTRDAYVAEVTVKYGGTAGVVELLTFLCCHDIIDNVTKPAAIELLIKLLEGLLICEHRCLAYLFGSSELLHVTWPKKHWSFYSLWCISDCLEQSRRHPFEPSSARTQTDDRQFDLALARTSVMLLFQGTPNMRGFIEFLSGYLCQPPSPSILDNDGNLGVVRLILETGALLGIAGMPVYFGYEDNTVDCGATILAAIISQLGRHLREGAAVREGEQLFQALVLTEVEGQDGATETWDLGAWLRTQAPEMLNKCPSAATALQRVHNALVELFPLCESNHELRVQWDRIGYPGLPGDIFSDPFLDVGAFFENAETPRARPSHIFEDPSLDLGEFFGNAEGWPYPESF